MNIVIKESFHNLGGLVAQAKIDENGKLQDGGNLEIKALDIFNEHLDSYINGFEFGAGIDFDTKYLHSQARAERINLLFGMTDKEKETYATIGRGKIEGNIHGDLNRDINARESEDGFEIETTRMFYQDGFFDTISSAAKDIHANPSSILTNVAKPFADAAAWVSDKISPTPEPKLTIWDVIDYDVDEDCLEDLVLNDIFAKEEIQDFKARLNNIVDETIIVKPLPDLEGAATDPIQHRLKEEAAVKAVAEKLVVLHAAYMEFAEDHPWVAEQGLRAFNIALQTLIAGPAGFANSVRGELSGEAINLVAGEHIAAGANAAIEAGAEQLMSRYSSLNKEEARILVAGTAMITVGVAEGSSAMKQILHSVSAKKVSKIDADYKSVDSSDYTGINKINAALHKKHGVEGFDWAEDYNKWLLNVDPSKIQRHHVFSNKNSELKKSDLFKEGLLDEKILNDPRNIMPLPKNSGIHPSMNTHSGRHTLDHGEKMKGNLDKIYKEYENKIITKDQIEARYWKEVNLEKESLYHGKSELYKKDIEGIK